MENIILQGVVIGIGYALIAIGISVTFRVLDLVNFAHGELYMLGGLFTFVTMQWFNLPYILSGLVAVVLTSVVAWLIYRAIGNVLVTDRLNTLLATFAISLMLTNAVNVYIDGDAKSVNTPFEAPLILGSLIISGPQAITIVVGLAAIFSIGFWLHKSFLGKQIRAVAENIEGAKIMGINTSQIYRLIFIGGGTLAGLAGVILSPITQVSAGIGLSAVIKGFVILVIGGIGSVAGAAIAGISLGIVEALSSTYVSSALKDVFGYALLFLVLLIPGNLMEAVKIKYRRLRKTDKVSGGRGTTS